jgi:hypothetical protein
VLHLNPGAAGRAGFHALQTAAVLTINDGVPCAEPVLLGPRIPRKLPLSGNWRWQPGVTRVTPTLRTPSRRRRELALQHDAPLTCRGLRGLDSSLTLGKAESDAEPHLDSVVLVASCSPRP